MVAIVGAGISGLALAYFLQEKSIPYILLESTDSPGGNIKTWHKDGTVLDLGPNSILCDEYIRHFITKIGLASEVVEALPVSKNRYVLKNGKYHKMPSSPLDLLFNNFFSWEAKIKIIKERNVRSKGGQNETLEAFFNRRFGEEVSNYALNPFISGIYAGDPKALLTGSTFPSLLEYENLHGSVLKGMMKNGTSRRKTINFKNGMQTMPLAIAAKLNNIRYRENVNQIVKTEEAFNMITTQRNYNAKHLVLACPASSIGHLLKNVSPGLAEASEKINYPPMVVIHSLYNKSENENSLHGFGGLNPKIENRFTAGSVWNSSVFPSRCPKDKFLITSFVGGSQYVENTHLPDGMIKENVASELNQTLGLKSKPAMQFLYKWDKSIPQYDYNILALEKTRIAAESDNIYLCSNISGGVSLPDCIKKAETLANKISDLANQ